MSAEATVVRNYIDWLVKVPWKKRTKIIKDIARAEKVLDEDHFGLEKVKERIIEYLAVQQGVDKLRGPILCCSQPGFNPGARTGVLSEARRSLAYP